VKISYGAALPVTWLSFRATLEGSDKVNLHWSTASESNNEGFDIQRSENGRDWQTIAFEAGAGTTSGITNYQYTDNIQSLITNHQSLYYRLQQRDYDGTTDYSPVRVIQLETNQGGVRLFPNPASEEATVAFAEPLSSRGRLQVFNENGRRVAEYALAPQTTEFSFRVKPLPAGTYLVKITAGAQEWVKRLVVE
jgi:trimeric autotransporter adhesin